MRNVKWMLAAGLVVATTAACTAETGYPATSNNTGYPHTGYYVATPAAVVVATPAPVVYAPVSPRGPNGDLDADGIPNRMDRDANGDRVADRYQR